MDSDPQQTARARIGNPCVGLIPLHIVRLALCLHINIFQGVDLKNVKNGRILD
jgi:hypothetical protein